MFSLADKSTQPLESLSKYFIIGVILPLVLLLALDYMIVRSSLQEGGLSYWWIGGLILVPKLMIIPWFGRRLMRYTEGHFKQFGSGLIKLVLFLCLPLFILIAVVSGVDAMQAIVAAAQKTEREASVREITYQFRFDQNSSEYQISGAIDFGITRDFRAFVEQNTGGRVVVLDSTGGSIYEGRGLAVLFQADGFDTHVSEECSSACTLAFIGGVKRTLGEQGKLGFHQYGLTYRDAHQETPFFDPVDEQVRDQEIFIEHGVDAAFVAKMFDQPQSGIWFPNQELLLRSGMVDAVK